MDKKLYTDIFDKTFNKHCKLLKEHFGLGEAATQDAANAGDHYKGSPRDEFGRVSDADISYVEQKTKGEVTKIISTLKGNQSGVFTSAVKRLQRISELKDEMERLESELKQDGVRERISALVGSKYEYCTRVMKLVSMYEIVLSKQPAEKPNTSWATVYEKLSSHLTPDLIKIAEGIIKECSNPSTPVPSISVKEPPVTEGIGSVWTSIVNKFKSWFSMFDKKMSGVESEIKKL